MNSGVFSITGTPIGAGAPSAADDENETATIIQRPTPKRSKRKSGLGSGGIS